LLVHVPDEDILLTELWTAISQLFLPLSLPSVKVLKKTKEEGQGTVRYFGRANKRKFGGGTSFRANQEV